MTDTPVDLIPTVETRAAASVDGVNFADRIITVLAVPYEQPAQVPFQGEMWSEVFSRSAFHGLDASKRRVPATACLEVPDRGHSNGRVVGKAILFDTTHEMGLRTELKISRTPQGDETLELANDGNLDVSVGFMVKNRLDQQLDRPARTRRINRSFLDHIAFVADQPAYPGAKVLAVRSDGSVEDDPLPFGATPYLDEFANDPIFAWARERTQS